MNSFAPGGLAPDEPISNKTAQGEHAQGAQDRRVPPSGWIAEWFTTLETPLVAYTRRCLGGDIEVAREVVQETFAKLCVQVWPDIEPQVTAWLYKTCRHQAIDITRRKGRIAMIPLGNEITALHDRSQHAAQQGVEWKVEQSEALAAMRQQIQQLSEQQQEVLRLRLKDGLSYQQIAEVTGLTASNVGYHLHQAVTTLRTRLVSSHDSPSRE